MTRTVGRVDDDGGTVMSLLLGNLPDLIGELWDGTDVPDTDGDGPVEDDYVAAPRE